MTMQSADIASRLKRFLDRKQMPRRLEGKGPAVEDEIRALVSAIARFAPRDAERLRSWWADHFEPVLGELSGGMWPTEKEVADAARQAISATRGAAPEGPKLDPMQITSDRMARGEPVPETYLYGIAAVELIAKRLVTEATMTSCRSGAFLARKEIYGEEAALAWEVEAKARHEAAKDVWRHRDDPRGLGGRVPTNRVSDAA